MSTLYAGLDVSLEMTSVCVVDAEGRLLAEKQVSSDPEAIAKVLLLVEGTWERVGLEAGPLSQWLFFGLKDAGLPAVCIETRHAKAAITAMSRNKNDRNDARSIAQIVRSGWFKAVHVKSTGGLTPGTRTKRSAGKRSYGKQSMVTRSKPEQKAAVIG